MTWDFALPQRGDVIRVEARGIMHYGIYVSDDEVIQFGPNPAEGLELTGDQVEVMRVDVGRFLQGGFLQVGHCGRREQKKRRSADDTVRYARERLGTRGYHILENNCEHFVNECLFDAHASSQVDAVRAFFRRKLAVHVYVSAIPRDVRISAVVPQERNRYIAECSNPSVKAERWYVWRVLEYALKQSFGYSMEQLHFRRLSSGQWICEECCFSLSHCNGAVAVAVAETPVGVDIEPCCAIMAKCARKMLAPQEQAQLEGLHEEQLREYLTMKWTQKESMFKQRGGDGFSPTQLIPDSSVKTQRITLLDEPYQLSISSRHVNLAKVTVIDELH